MALFSEYAVTPDVFDDSCYESPNGGLCGVYVRQLQEVFLSEGIVRDLRDKEWSRQLLDHNNPWHTHANKLLKVLEFNGRLVPIGSVSVSTPTNDCEWCKEALSATNRPDGIIVSSRTKNSYKKNSLVESVEKLSFSTKCTWWSPRDGSIRLKRDINDYKGALKLILKHARYIKFIDPYIYPKRSGYAGFIQLLEAASNRPSKSPQLRVEIHTTFRNINKKSKEESLRIMKDTFQKKFAGLSRRNLEVKVFIWNDFHDRYLVSNLGGIQMSNGFDTSTGPLKTTWSRLGQTARKKIEDDFDLSKKDEHEHEHPKCQLEPFTIPQD